MAEQIGRFKPGENVSVFAATAISAGRFVTISGDKTARGDYSGGHAGAAGWALGVSQRDSAATTEPAHSQERLVEVMRGGIARVEVGTGGLTAGAAVKSDAAGKAVAQGGSGVILGYACETAVAGEFAEIAQVL